MTHSAPSSTPISFLKPGFPCASAPAWGRIFWRGAAATAALLGSSTLFAQSAPLVLEDALRAAFSTHPSVAARRSERQAADMKLDVALRQQYPGLVAQTGSDATGGRSTTLRVTQPLWTGGRITGEINLAEATIRQADASVAQAQLDIMMRVANAFTELGRVQARQLAAQSNVEEHVRLAEMIQRRVASQVSPASDGIQADARLAQARAELIQLDALAVKFRSSLAQATGRPVVEIALPSPRNLADSNLPGIVDAALAYAPALQRLQHEYEAATADITIKRSAAYPQVQARMDHNRTRTGSNTQVYVALDVQTGAGFSVMAMVREAEARRDAIQSQMETVRRDTAETVSADWADYQSQIQQSRSLNAQVQATTLVFDSFVRQYSVGRKGWNDVLNAQREVAQARYQLADADWGALRSALRLQMATGLLNPTQLVSPAQASVQPQAVPQAVPPSTVLAGEPLPKLAAAAVSLLKQLADAAVPGTGTDQEARTPQNAKPADQEPRSRW